MSQTVDNRIVEMQFDNKDFEQNAQKSLKTLQELKDSMKFDDAAKNLEEFNKATTKVDFSTIMNSLDNITEKLSTFRLLGIHALSNVVDAAMQAGKKIFSALSAPIAQMKSGGWARAANLENAKFQMQGILGSADKVAEAMKNVDDAVTGTAYSLDEAAKIAAQLTASGVQLGPVMTNTLKSIAGVAAQTNSSFGDIGNIFATVKGQGKLMTMQLRQLEARGLNAAATIGESMKKSEAEIREMVTKGQVSFEDFSKAMQEAFGENAAKANDTFDGALANMKSALNRIGAEFATPLRKNMIPVFNSVRLFINEIKKSMSGLFPVVSRIMEVLSKTFVDKITKLKDAISSHSASFNMMDHLAEALKITFTNLVRIVRTIGAAFREVFPNSGGILASLTKFGQLIEDISVKLFVSDEGLAVFKEIMKSLFTVLKVLLTILSKVLTVAGALIKVVARIVGFAFSLVGSLINLVAGLFQTEEAEEGVNEQNQILLGLVEKLRAVFEAFKNVLAAFYPILERVGQAIATVIITIASLVGFALYSAFEKVKELIDNFKTSDPFSFLKEKVASVLEVIGGFIERLKEIPIVGNLVSILEVIFSKVTEAIVKTIGFIRMLFDEIRRGEMTLDRVKELFGIIAARIMDFRNKIVAFLKGETTSETLNFISRQLNAAAEGVKRFVLKVVSSLKDLTPGRIILFSFAVGVLVLLNNINKLIKGITSLSSKITSVLSDLSKPFKNLNSGAIKFSITLFAVSAAVLAVAGALKIISDIPPGRLVEARNALLALGGLMMGASLLSVIIDGVTKATKGVGSFSRNVLAFAAGVVALAGALWVLDQVRMDNIWYKVIVLAGICGVLAITANLLPRSAKKMNASALYLLAFAGAVFILAMSLEKITSIDFAALSGYWREILSIFIGIAAIAAIASSFGMGSILGFVGFVVGIRTLLTQLEKFKDTEAGKQLYTIVDKLKEYFKMALERLKEIVASIRDYLTTLSSSEEAFQRFSGAILSISGIILLIAGVVAVIGQAGKGLKKAAWAFVIFSAALVGLIYFSRLLAEWLEEVPELKTAIGILTTMIIVIGLVAALIAAATREGSLAPKAIRAASLVFVSAALMMVAMAGFMDIIARLPEKGFERARSLLQSAIGIISVLILIESLVSMRARKSAAGFGHFAGMVLMYAVLLGSLIVIMQMIQDEEDYIKLLAAVTAVSIVCWAISEMMDSFGSMQKDSWKPIVALVGGFILVIGALVGAAILLKDNDPIIMAKQFGAMGIALLELTLVIWSLTKMAKKFENDEGETLTSLAKSFNKLVLVFIELAAAALILKTTDPVMMAKQFAACAVALAEITLVVWGLYKLADKFEDDENGKLETLSKSFLRIGAVFGIIGAVAYLLKDVDGKVIVGHLQACALVIGELFLVISGLYLLATKFEDEEGKNLDSLTKSFALLGGVFVAIGLLAYILKDVDGGKIIGHLQACSLVLLELTVLMAALAYMTNKNNKYKVTPATMRKMVLSLSIMTGLFVAIGLLAVIMDGIDTKDMMKHTHAIMLTLVELSAVMLIVSKISKKPADLLRTAISISAMVVVFTALALVFGMINSFNLDAGQMMKNTHVITLVLTELSAISLLVGSLSSSMGKALIGEVGLLGMIGLFYLLAKVFEIINGLQIDGMMAKSQAIILVLTELAVIGLLVGVVLGALIDSGIGALGLVGGMAALWGLIALFKYLTTVFEIIDDMKIEGILAKSQVIVLVMLEIAVIGLISIVSIPALVGGISMLIMIALFKYLAEVFTIIDGIQTEGLVEKSQQMILIMLELEGLAALLGVISPLALIALAGIPSLLAMTKAMKEIALALSELSGMSVGDVQGKLDAFISALTSLIGIGVAGIVSGPGLILVAGGVSKLSQALLDSVDSFEGAAKAIIDFGNSFIELSNNFGKFASDLYSTLQFAIQSIVPNVYLLFYGLGAAIIQGFRDGATWHSPPAFITDFFSDVAAAFNAFPSKIVGIVKAAGELVGAAFEPGFRKGSQWYCTPFWENQFFKDVIGGFKDFASNSLGGISIAKKAGEMLGQAFGDGTIAELAESKIGIGNEIKDIMGMFTQLETAYRGYSTTLENFQYQLKTDIGSADNRLKTAEQNYQHWNSVVTKEKLKRAIGEENANKIIQKNLETYKSQIDSLKGIVETSTTALDDLNTAMNGVADEADEEVNNPYKGLEGGAGSAKEAVDELYESTLKTLEGQMNIFDKFEAKDPMSPETMIENMESQINGMTKWAGDMNTLAARGVDQGILQKLAELGPAGQDKLSAFVNMTDEQLAHATELWGQSLMLPTQITDQLMLNFQGIGVDMYKGLENGLSGEQKNVVALAKDNAKEVHDETATESGVASPSWKYDLIGFYCMLGLKQGFKRGEWTVIETVKFIADKIVTTMTESLKPEDFKEMGSNAVKGLLEGLESHSKELEKVMSKLARKDIAGTFTSKDKGVAEESPSKLFRQFGVYIVEGLVIGINETAHRVDESISALKDPAVETMKQTIAGISKMVEDGVDDPVIKPVLDLSDIASGARTISSLLGSNATYGVSGSLDNLQNGKLGVGGTTFIQNNYSPKALSRADIYRQTRNQFSQYTNRYIQTGY